MTSSETLDRFNLANEKLKEIFGDDNVSWSIPLNDGGDKQKHIIKQVCQIDVLDNKVLQDILTQHNIEFKNCEFGFLNINDFKNTIVSYKITKNSAIVKSYILKFSIFYIYTRFKNTLFKDNIFKICWSKIYII